METDPKDLSRQDALQKLCETLHAGACARGDRFYIDPLSGYQVTTQVYLESIGKCCESGCRHCPYGFVRTSE